MFQEKCKVEEEILKWVQKYDEDMTEKQVLALSALLCHQVICSGRFLSRGTGGSYPGNPGSGERQFCIQVSYRKGIFVLPVYPGILCSFGFRKSYIDC